MITRVSLMVIFSTDRSVCFLEHFTSYTFTPTPNKSVSVTGLDSLFVLICNVTFVSLQYMNNYLENKFEL